MRAWMKYWLTAVSSAVRMSFSRAMTSSSPFMGAPPGERETGLSINRPRRCIQEVGEHRAAGAAVVTSATGGREVIETAGSRLDEHSKCPVAHGPAGTDDHVAPRIEDCCRFAIRFT